MPPTRKPSAKILLVDDNQLGLTARRSVLEEHGHKIVTCMAPQEALRLFANECFDLVITDYKMPRLNGIEFIQQLRKQQPEVRIILLSGFTESLGLNEQNTGADAVMQKSANEVSHLVNAVNRLLRKVPKKSSRKPPGSESAPPKRARGQGV